MNNIKMEDYLKSIIQKYTDLACEGIEVETHFQELGINSFMMMEMAKEISEELKITLPNTIFFEYSNLKELATYFDNNHTEAIKNWSSSSSENQFLIEDDDWG